MFGRASRVEHLNNGTGPLSTSFPSSGPGPRRGSGIITHDNAAPTPITAWTPVTTQSRNADTEGGNSNERVITIAGISITDPIRKTMMGIVVISQVSIGISAIHMAKVGFACSIMPLQLFELFLFGLTLTALGFMNAGRLLLKDIRPEVYKTLTYIMRFPAFFLFPLYAMILVQALLMYMFYNPDHYYQYDEESMEYQYFIRCNRPMYWFLVLGVPLSLVIHVAFVLTDGLCKGHTRRTRVLPLQQSQDDVTSET